MSRDAPPTPHGQLIGAAEPGSGPHRRTILVVEDDPSIADSVVRGLERAGFAVHHAGTAAEAGQQVASVPLDLVVLDLGLPDDDGFTLLQRWRESTPGLPVIVLTANTQLEARLRSLELGAVDWMAKPFWLEELLARIQVRLGRARTTHTSAEPALFRWADAELDPTARLLLVGGTEVRLSPQEFALLAWLVQHPGKAMTRKQLSEAALEGSERSGDRAVDTYVARLRRKLGPSGNAIETVWGLGYRFRHAP